MTTTESAEITAAAQTQEPTDVTEATEQPAEIEADPRHPALISAEAALKVATANQEAAGAALAVAESDHATAAAVVEALVAQAASGQPVAPKARKTAIDALDNAAGTLDFAQRTHAGASASVATAEKDWRSADRLERVRLWTIEDRKRIAIADRVRAAYSDVSLALEEMDAIQATKNALASVPWATHSMTLPAEAAPSNRQLFVAELPSRISMAVQGIRLI